MGIGVLLVTTTLPEHGCRACEAPAGARWCPTSPRRWPRATWRATPTSRGKGNDVRGRRPGAGVPGPIARRSSTSASCASRPLVLTFLVTRGADCEPQVDRVERIRREFPDVSFAAVVGGNEREEVEQIVRRRGWGMPVAVDEDDAVVNLYGVGGVPDHRVLRGGRQGPRDQAGQPHRGRAACRGHAGCSEADGARPRAGAGLGRRRAGRGVPRAARSGSRAWRRGSGRSSRPGARAAARARRAGSPAGT